MGEGVVYNKRREESSALGADDANPKRNRPRGNSKTLNDLTPNGSER